MSLFFMNNVVSLEIYFHVSEKFGDIQYAKLLYVNKKCANGSSKVGIHECL
jgi:hypothetical protein